MQASELFPVPITFKVLENGLDNTLWETFDFVYCNQVSWLGLPIAHKHVLCHVALASVALQSSQGHHWILHLDFLQLWPLQPPSQQRPTGAMTYKFYGQLSACMA